MCFFVAFRNVFAVISRKFVFFCSPFILLAHYYHWGTAFVYFYFLYYILLLYTCVAFITTIKRIKKKCTGEHIKLWRQETNTHAIRFDIVSESFHFGTGRYSRNMRAWMTTTIMLKVVMTTRIIASIKLRTNPLYQTLLMIEQWMILYLVCRFW